MRKLLTFVCLLVITLSFSSCQKELDEEAHVFLGDWNSKTYALQIYSNGYGICNTKKWGGLTCDGIVKVKSDRIVFTSKRESSTLLRKKFDIDQLPTVDAAGVTFMILDGERFEKR